MRMDIDYDQAIRFSEVNHSVTCVTGSSFYTGDTHPTDMDREAVCGEIWQ